MIPAPEEKLPVARVPRTALTLGRRLPIGRVGSPPRRLTVEASMQCKLSAREAAEKPALRSSDKPLTCDFVELRGLI